MSKSQDLFDRRKKVVPRGISVFNPSTAVSARGAIITDADGRRLIDFAGGIGVVNAGHCPESVVAAVVEQAGKFLHTSFNVAAYEPYIRLCENLVEILPHGEATKAMLVCTGAEAVENAVKIARQATKRPAIVCYSEAYHGRTMMAMTLTSNVAYKPDCGPFAPEVYRLPFPDIYHRAGENIELFVEQELARLETLTRNQVEANKIAAVIIELVQGEGGFNPAPKAYVEGLRRFCDQHGILLIFDEVQSGFGRCGNWAAWQEYAVVPDLSTYAKSMGSGMPIAAVVGRADVMEAAAPGSIGGTYIGNPVCCAAAIATIALMKERHLNERGKQVGEIIRSRFLRLKSRFAQIGDVRGVGAMLAMEFVKDADPLHPDPALCSQLIAACAENGLILISAGTNKNVVRVLCPLVISDDDLETGLTIIEAQLARLVAEDRK
jgi:4-aminobutyrate aminotransferase/(S)-3-amino-2-methylpropionate transaminase